MKTKIKTFDLWLLEPAVQKKIIEKLNEPTKTSEVVKNGKTSEETLASWIYKDVLAPLGW